MTDNNYLTIDEFCDLFNISRATYYRLKQRRTGPPEMIIGQRVRILRSDAETWAQERKHGK